MWSQDQAQWQQVVNPNTGRPFEDYGQYSGWASGMEGQGAAASSAFGTAKPADYAWGGEKPDWSKTGWNIGKNGKFNYGNETFTPPNNTFGFQIGDKVGYIVPQTGEIVFGSPGGTGAVGYDDTKLFTGYSGGRMVGEGYGTGVPGAMGVVQSYGSTTGGGYWDINADYGLGRDMKGIIPLEHNSSGNVSQFLAPTPGGGFVKTPNASEAIASRDAYLEWLKTNPSQGGIGQTRGVPTTQTATPTTGSTSPSQQGVLTVPGKGEKQFDLTQSRYLSGPQRGDRAFGDRPTQPTESEQYWNQWEGQFQNPDSLKAVYDRAEKQAQSTLDRKASSSGWADSSAAAKATANIGQNFNDAYVRAMQDFAKTGATMAGAADSAKNAQTNAWLNTVGTAQGLDTSDLAYLTAGQSAANSAQTLGENRLTGGFDRALQVANNMSAIASYGLDKAQQRDIAYKMADLQQQIRLGTMDYQQATDQLDEYLATLRIAPSTAQSIANTFKASTSTSTGTKATV